MSSATPRVFISHSSADKNRFVLKFASRLRQQGVDAWVDCWEIAPGDSLVEKIWSEGLANSDVVIVVVSPSSARSKWVREELSTAVVKRIEGQIRLIPLRLDHAEMPPCLTALLWKEITDLENYDEVFSEVVRAIYGHSLKPPLGPPPPYVKKAAPITGLDRIDSLVLECACKAEIETGLPMAERDSFGALVDERGITVDQIIESQEVLQGRRLVKLDYTLGHHPQAMEVLPAGFDLYAQTNIPDLQELLAEAGRRIVREEQMDNRALADALGKPLRVMTHVLAVLESKGWIRTGEAYGVGYHHIDVLWVSPELKRWLETL